MYECCVSFKVLGRSVAYISRRMAMNRQCSFHFSHYREILELGLTEGYVFKTCHQYCGEQNNEALISVIRHDVDYAVERSIEFAIIERDLAINTTYFFRIHANEYNCLSYEVLPIIRELESMGHEIGLHVEPIDAHRAMGIPAMESMRIAIRVMEEILGHPFCGIACHNDWTPDNNLSFFDARSAETFGLEYEAYDRGNLDLFYKSRYVTDGHFWWWRSFDNGVLTDNRQCLCKQFLQRHPRLYSLTHPHAWYHLHYHRPMDRAHR